MKSQTKQTSTKVLKDGTWEDQYFSPKFLYERRERIILQVGRDKFTRYSLGELIGPYTSQSVSNLRKVLRRFKAGSIKRMAGKINLDMLLGGGGAGEATLDLWLRILNVKGVNPVDWLNTSLKILTVCAHSKRAYTKRRRSK